MDYPRIAVVGAGGLSSGRIYPYLGAAGAQLVGVCDLDLEKATQNAARFGGRAYGDMADMLDAETPDGVIICIGPEQHAALAPVALRRGLAVYTEKPPAPAAAAALQVARAAKEAGVLCMTGFKKRHNTAYTRAREWLAGFPPEDLYALSIDYASAHYRNDTPRRSFLLDFALHIIDLTPFLFGEVARVFCFAKGLDAYAVSLQFCNGAVGSLSLNDARSFSVPTEEVELSVRGGNFMTIHNSSSWRLTEAGLPTEWREPPTFTSSGDSGNDTGHLAELVDFVTALREARTSSVSEISESYKSMVLFEAIRRSAAEGRVVDVVYEAV